MWMLLEYKIETWETFTALGKNQRETLTAKKTRKKTLQTLIRIPTLSKKKKNSNTLIYNLIVLFFFFLMRMVLFNVIFLFFSSRYSRGE